MVGNRFLVGGSGLVQSEEQQKDVVTKLHCV